MLAFDPDFGGQNVIQDSPPFDGMAIVFVPSIVNDVTGSVPQLDSEASTRSFMQIQFRITAENMNDLGLVYSGTA